MADKQPAGRRSPPGLGIQGVLVILALGLFATSAWAHRMLVFAYAEGDTIQVESKFVPDTPVHQGRVQVLDSKTGQVLVRGQTDDQGRFSFQIPPKAKSEHLDLKIVVESTMGHRGEWLLKAASYLTGASMGKAVEPAPAAAAAPKAPDTRAVPLDQQALEAALQKTLERQLAPIKEKLTELSVHRTSLTDIIGGLGYIMGIFGLWAYLQSKKRKDS
jgi:nickel transport protein